MNTGHFWGNFDKFLLTAFVVYFSLMGYFSLHHTTPENPFAVAMLDNQKLVLGALLGLITGRALQRIEDRPPSSPVSNPPNKRTTFP